MLVQKVAESIAEWPSAVGALRELCWNLGFILVLEASKLHKWSVLQNS